MERINFKNTVGDKFIYFNINNSTDSTNKSDNINSFVEERKEININPIIDEELIRFKIKSGKTLKIYPQFKYIDNTYSNNYINALFTRDEIVNRREVFTNSYYLFDYYDTISPDNQVNLSVNYVKADTKNVYTTQIINSKINTIFAELTFNKNNLFSEFNNINIPNNLLTTFPMTIYLKLSFFSAKLGKRSFFIIDESFDDYNKYYLPITLDNNYEWWISNNNSNIISLYPKENKNILLNNNDFNNQPYPELTAQVFDNKLIIGTGEIITKTEL